MGGLGLKPRYVMMEKKTAREIAGLTHTAMKGDPQAWFRLASSFHAAATVLNDFQERIPSDSRPFVFNAALSLELLFKSVLAKENVEIPDGREGHDLGLLCQKAGITLSANQALTLELMTEELIWFARYPTPKQAQRFDRFHDVILEKHMIRTHSGNVFRTMANRETFSDFENYTKLWGMAVEKFTA